MAVAQTEILDKISSMTVLELSELIKAMEEKFGVSAAAAVAAVAPAAAAAPAAEEQTEFTVMLTAIGDNKVKVIRQCASSRVWGSRKRRTSSTARRRRSRKASTRPMPRQQRRSWRLPAAKPRSSNRR